MTRLCIATRRRPRRTGKNPIATRRRPRRTGKNQKALFAACALLAACHEYQAVNFEVMAGTRVAHARGAPATRPAKSGTIGEVGGRVVMVDTGDGSSGLVDLEARVGGNVRGPAGTLAFALETGPATPGGPYHLFARAGVAGRLDGDPYRDWMALDAPTLTAGFQYHGLDGDTFADSLHVEIAGLGAFGIAGRTDDAGTGASWVAAPELGGSLLMLGPGVTAEARYVHGFRHDSFDRLQGRACAEILLALCVDGEIVGADFGAPQRGTATVFGVTLGVGAASRYTFRP